ncbi:MAG: winged helix-turn-helix domain-containing protein [Anaerolineae bacterium]
MIVLTAYGSLESAIEAVRAGAADYLLKPCSLRDTEMAIAQALQKHRERLFISAESSARGSEPSRRILRRGPVTLDCEKALVLVSGSGGAMSHAVQLTPSEAALLACLMQSPDTVRSCRALAHEALGYQVSEQEARELVRPHISRLRHKIEAVLPGPTLIRTVRSKGYLFSVDLSPPLAH